MTALKLENICKSYGQHAILQGVNLEVKEKEFVILVGPSGCGKSTLLNIIAGLEDLSSGQVKMQGIDVTQAAPKHRNIAMVFQSYALYPNMTVRENISFGLKLKNVPKVDIEKKVKEVSAILQIENLLDRKPGQLSGGQRQRVAMGRAIARDPKLYLFDEPLSNLDAQLRTTMRKEIKKLHQRIQCAVVYVTHDQQEAMTLGDRIAVMKDGHIMQIGTPSEVYEQPQNMFVANFIGSPSMNFIRLPVEEENGSIGFSFKTEQAKVFMPASDHLKPWLTKEVVVGIRPESFRLSDTPKLATFLEIKPFLIENTGSDEFEHFILSDHEVVARSHRAISPDQPRYISLDPEKILFFDPQTTERIFI